MSVFGAYARYYDLLYRDKDYAGEAAYVAALVARFHGGAGSLLELGCGTGRHAALLAGHGYEVVGVDRSDVMLSRARERVAGAARAPHFLRGDIREVELDRTFDVVVSLFHVISYQTGNDDLERSFERIRSHLEPGGIVIFDCWYGPAVLSLRPAVRVLRREDERTRLTRLAEPVLDPRRNTVDVNYEILLQDRASGDVERITETHCMRYLFEPEIRALMDRHGLELVHGEEWMTGSEPSCDTWGVCFVGKG